MQRLSQNGAPARPEIDRRGVPLVRILVDDGAITPQAMIGALAEAGRLAQPLSQVLAAEGLVAPEALLRAQADHYGVLALRRVTLPPEARAMAKLSAAFCLAHGVLPWMYVDDTLVVASARPETFDETRAAMPADIGAVMMAVTLEQDIHDAIAERHGTTLAAAAETARNADESCRDIPLRPSPLVGALAAAMAGSILLLLAFAPNMLFGAALGLAIGSLVVAQGLKLAALMAQPFLRRGKPGSMPKSPPRISILVPLFHEKEIAVALVSRLSRLRYPRTLLEILLVLEEDDAQTAKALSHVQLPPSFRTVRVPPGSVKTKPRALNYALNFTTGSIIGIYDAEDAPAADQLEQVVARFERAPKQVACLQGVLDFYNPHANWLSRCFAVEYAGWFRVILPGLARLGFVVPLGGTTLFIRREALERTQGWDAHNVTEDADLGILLARRGYVTEILPTVTQEEANNRLWPWIRQRSRWLKGYALTWWVHARRPSALIRDLGFARALGVHALFLSTVLSLLLAPVLWSFWLIVFGLPHPLYGILQPKALGGLVILFLTAEAITLMVGITAIARSTHARLLPWVPTTLAYYPLGTIALYKGLWEVVRRPFYWDKTQHGHSQPESPDADKPAPERA
jgi:cellulose synthase/poly-beta-1,6-N-acetylglucosamine synthase-like glycosyltransferase